MITCSDIEAAHDRVRPHVRRTPVIALEAGAVADCAVVLKLEHLQHTGSFKVRGAFNTMLSADLPEAGVVAASGGNHGAAVAYAATALGAKSVIFVPKLIAKEVKLARMRHFGAEVIVADGSVGDVMAAYARHAEETGALAVHPYDGPGTLGGQGTVGLEIEAEVPELDTLLVSVGGGGLIGGIAAWYGDRVNVVAVETEGTATVAHALAHGLGQDHRATGVAASSLGGPDLGPLAYEILKAQGRPNVVVTDADVYEAQRRLWDSARIVVEPGAATALAALSSGAYIPGKTERVGMLLCGGNAEPDWFLHEDQA